MRETLAVSDSSLQGENQPEFLPHHWYYNITDCRIILQLYAGGGGGGIGTDGSVNTNASSGLTNLENVNTYWDWSWQHNTNGD